MNRQQRRALERDLGHKTAKMKRRRPPEKEAVAAFRQAVMEKQSRIDTLLGREWKPAPKLWTP